MRATEYGSRESGWANVTNKLTLMELIGKAPWREAVTYRETWPHEYVLLRKDNQRELFAVMAKRFKDGEGIQGRFFSSRPTYLFMGGFKFWFDPPLEDLDSLREGKEYVLNRVPLFYDRRDFITRPGDTRFPEDYRVAPPLSDEPGSP